MKRFNGFLAFIVILVFALQITGCGPGEGTGKPKKVPVKVAFWGSPEEIGIITEMLKNWQKTHPEIQVKLEHIPFGSYVSKILTEIAGRSAPDIIASEVNMFVSFADKDVFLDLKPFVDKDKSFNLGDFFPEVVDRYTVDGKILGIPRDTAPFACVYYNKKLFDEAGLPYPTDDWDWNDLLDKAKKLTKVDKDGKVVQYGFYSDMWPNFILSEGGRIVDNVKHPTKCLMNSPESMEGLQFLVDLSHKYKVSPTSNTFRNLGLGVIQMFMMQRVAMFHSGIWETPIVRKVKDFDWDVAMFPKSPKGIRKFATGGTAYGILKTTKYPEQAWEVLKALSGDEGQIMLAESGLAQPANKKIAEGEHFAGSNKPPLNKKMLIEAVKYCVYDPFNFKWREIREKYINPEFDLVFNGLKPVKEAVNAIVPKANELLKEGR
ncbi:MAG: sugar ABC transporter substrate-binding protein [Candidatus Omnitrophica bacterium]|nr:sugar ABC transporter substrate-binding protein [Candidatus Omnitrophota bacterium]